MTVTYFKRFRMEIELAEAPVLPTLPTGYFWVAWHPGLLEAHADTKYRSFRGEIDTTVFPSLGTYQGCLDLMRRLVRREGFVPEATWLLATADEYCGTIQGLIDDDRIGAIQNVGVVEAHRGQGLGSALVQRALAGFYEVGLRRAFLEVTAENKTAVSIYEKLGFRTAKTLFKAVHILP